MTSKTLYISLGTAVFLGNIAYHTFDDRISSVQEQINDIRADVKEIKQAVLGRRTVNIKYRPQDVECLARNIYWEAGVEDMTGKIAVGTITLNRVRTRYWGHKICDVVYSKDQFSWTKEKKRAWVTLKGKAWADSKAAAEAVLTQGIVIEQLDKALYYHADYVDPNWRDNRHKVLKVGRHIFYNQAKGTNIKL